MELSEIKRDLNLLLAVLGINAPSGRQNVCCPFHDETNPSFQLFRGGDGVWIWKCYSGCGTGTIIDAAMKKYNLTTCRDACNELERELGVPIGRDEEYMEPVIDAERANGFIADMHAALINSPELLEAYMVKKRGLTLNVVKRFNLGFVVCGKEPTFSDKNWRVFGWVLPITRADGAGLVGVKLHTERPPWPNGPKCLWAPFGLYPERTAKVEPKHGALTLWPPPEIQDRQADLFLCPGELKALALIAAGKWATAPTSGENKLPERLIQRIKTLNPDKVFICYDDDKPKLNPTTQKLVSAGNVWKDAMMEAFTKAGIPTFPFSYSRPIAVSAGAKTSGILYRTGLTRPEIRNEGLNGSQRTEGIELPETSPEQTGDMAASDQTLSERRATSKAASPIVQAAAGTVIQHSSRPAAVALTAADRLALDAFNDPDRWQTYAPPPARWSPEEIELIVWYRDAKRRGLLPEPPFHITGVGGNGYGFYDMVERAIEKGPLDEHALTASVGDWLRGLKQLSEVPW